MGSGAQEGIVPKPLVACGLPPLSVSYDGDSLRKNK